MTSDEDLMLLTFASPRILLEDDHTQHAKTVLNHLGFVIIENAFSKEKYYSMMRALMWGLQETCGRPLDPQNLCRDLWEPRHYDVEEGEIAPPPTRLIDKFQRKPGGEVVPNEGNVNMAVLETVCAALPDDVHIIVRRLCGDREPTSPRFFISEFTSEGGDVMYVGKKRAHGYRVFLLVEPGNRKIAFKPRGYDGYIAARSGTDPSWGTVIIAKMATLHQEMICKPPRDPELFCREEKGDTRPRPAFYRCTFVI